MDNNELMHYGILGMRWGIRRTEAQLARATKRVDKLKAKKKEHDKLTRAKNRLNKMLEEEQTLKGKVKSKPKVKSETNDKSEHDTEVKKVKNLKKKKISEMTSEELQAKIDRMNLEKRYSDLMKEKNPPKSTKGRDFVKGILEDSAKNIGKQTVTYVMGTLVNKGAKKFFDGIDDDIVNPKKGQKDK